MSDYVKITKIISYDLVANPGFVSARMTGVFETFEERMKRLKKERNIFSKQQPTQPLAGLDPRSATEWRSRNNTL